MNSTYHWFIPKPGDATGMDPGAQVVRVQGDLVWFFGTMTIVDRKNLKGWLGPALAKPAHP